MTASAFANLLAFAVLAACLYRARLLALALIPPCALILVRFLELVDTESASHPLRFVVPILSLSVAMWVAYTEARKPKPNELRAMIRAGIRMGLGWYSSPYRDTRQLVASILVFASGCTDIPALLAWRLPGEWVLVPLQIFVCLVILGVLLAPERWFSRWT